MKCNVGGVDRTGRLVLGVALLLVGFLAPLSTGWKAAVFVFAGIALITGITRYCPANQLLGIDTCGSEDTKHGGTA